MADKRTAMKIFQGIADLVGNTPLVELMNFEDKNNLNFQLLAKVEFLNPSGSIKDRTALYLLKDALKSGKVKKDTVIIEPTSGNTGIALAMLAEALGNRVILTMPRNMSAERMAMMSAYGAEIVLTPAESGMNGAVEKAEELAHRIRNSYVPSQFNNPAGVQAHYETTGPEIWQDSEGQIDILVAGVGTGGTITGTGRYLKGKNPSIKVIAVEPEGSAVLSRGKKGSHNIQGIGAGFVPAILDTFVYDEVIRVSDKDAIVTAKKLVANEGLFAGISSGAALWAALQIGRRPENKNKMVVVILPDSGNRYYTTWSEEQ